MDVEKVFHMTGGVGHTSYARNSSFQKRASDMVKHITLETLIDLYLTNAPNSLGIADLGCSSGKNSLSIIREMVNAIEQVSCKISQPVPELRIHLNDLLTNDFNAIFLALPEFYEAIQKDRDDGGHCIYISAYPGSFYGRLFPNNCLHFVYSSYSLHWLSRIPHGLYDEHGRSINKSAVYISASSPPQVSEAYNKQFQEDFSLFLRSRAREVVDGGKMVLIFLGRIGASHVDRGNFFFWELLTRSFALLVSQGDIEEEKLESYNVHFYAPSKEEFGDEVRKEGSFETERLEMFEIDREVENGSSYGMVVASTVRAIQESTIKHHFGDKNVDILFEKYANLVDEEMSKEEIRPITFLVVLKKKMR